MDLLAALRLFDRALARRSFVQAARDLDVSPATVTRAVQALERHYGVELLRRSTRGMVPTDAGRRLYEGGLNLLDAEAWLQETVAGAKDAPLSGPLRVTVPSAFGVAVIAPIAARFAIRHPGVILDLLSTDRFLDLVAENIDLAVRIGPLANSSLIQKRIAILPEVLVAAPGYLERAGTVGSPEQLQDHAFLALSILRDARPSLTLAAADGRDITVGVRRAMSFDTPLGLRVALLEGAGIGRIHRYLVEDDIAAGRLVTVLRDWRCPAWDVTLVTTTRARGPAVNAFAKVLSHELPSNYGVDAVR